jgi:hypothetical protein
LCVLGSRGVAKTVKGRGVGAVELLFDRDDRTEGLPISADSAQADAIPLVFRI